MAEKQCERGVFLMKQAQRGPKWLPGLCRFSLWASAFLIGVSFMVLRGGVTSSFPSYAHRRGDATKYLLENLSALFSGQASPLACLVFVAALLIAGGAFGLLLWSLWPPENKRPSGSETP